MDRRRRHARPRWLIALVGAAAVLAACSNNTTTTGSGSGTTTKGTAAGGNVIKIGVIAPLDAGLTDFGHGILNSTKLAVDQANKSNAIPGYTLVVEAVNDSSDPAIGEEAAKKLAADPAVIGVVGPYNSGVAAKAAPVLAAAGIPLISPSNTNPTLTLGDDPSKPKRPNATYFRMVGSDIEQAKFLARQAKDKPGVTTVAVVSETKAVSKGLADNFAADFKALGGEVVAQEVVPDDAQDFTDVINKIKPLNPSLIFFGGEYPVAARLREQASNNRINTAIMGGDGMKDDAYLKAAGPGSAGDMASSVGVPMASLATAKPFVEAYTAAGYKEPPTDYGPYSYDATNILIAAAAKAVPGKGVTPDTRKVVVEALQVTNATGVTGKIEFDAYGDNKHPTFTLYVVKADAGQVAWVAQT